MKHSLVDTLAAMTDDQLHELVAGITAIQYWYGGLYSGKAGEGKLLVGSVDYTLVATTMSWLTKYFCPPAALKFTKVYRVHDFRNTKPRLGKTLDMRAFKPLLSWSESQRPDVSEREPRANDHLLSTVPVKVIWSYKFAQFLDEQRPSHAELAVLVKDTPIRRRKLLNEVSRELVSLLRDMENFSDEREVVLWHGNAPFKVTVLSKAK